MMHTRRLYPWPRPCCSPPVPPVPRDRASWPCPARQGSRAVQERRCLLPAVFPAAERRQERRAELRRQRRAQRGVGTLLGAAAGAALGGHEGAGVGAGTGLVVGGLVGTEAAGYSAYATQQRYDIAYVQCMYDRGHRVPVSGRLTVERSRSAYPPPPPAAPPTRASLPPPPMTTLPPAVTGSGRLFVYPGRGKATPRSRGSWHLRELGQRPDRP